jgi:hypothetical protein
MSYLLRGLIVKEALECADWSALCFAQKAATSCRTPEQKKSRSRMLSERLSGGTVWIDLGL